MRSFQTNPDASWLDAAPDAIVVTNETGTVVFANRRCQELLGWSPEQLVGQPVEVLIPGRVPTHADLRERAIADHTLRPMGAAVDLVALHKNGLEIPVDIALSQLEFAGAHHVVAAIRDVTVQRDMLHQLRVQSIALRSAASGVVITSREGIITWVNPAVCKMSGYSREELLGQRPSILKSGEHDAAFYADLWSTVTAGRTWHGDIINRTKEGTLYHEEQTIAPVPGKNGEITHFIAIKQDVTQRVIAEQRLRATRDELAQRVAEVEGLHARLREQAIRDPLTGLFNRRYLDETLPRELANARRDGGAVTLAVLDVDHFKVVNDTHGHAQGDRLLTQMGHILTTRSRAGDVACRFGGEEFVVVLLGASLTNSIRRADDWRQAFAEVTLEGPSGAVRATCSIGVAAWTPPENAGDLFARADAALYEAKNGGRNAVVAASPPTRAL